MLQFSSNDTVRWAEKFGNKSGGDHDYSGTGVFDNAKTTFTGTETHSTGTVGSNSGFSIGDIVLIHQSRDGGDGAGVWQLNKITNISSNTFTFKYPLQHDFGTTAQIIRVIQHKDITISGNYGVSGWDGSTGGIAVLMGNSVSGSGTLNLNGLGYRGATTGGGSGSSDSNVRSFQGEGTLGGGNYLHAANGNGGGGSSGSGSDGGNSGGGGGNANAGGNGGAGQGSAGIGGTSAGNEELTTLVFGGGGGKGRGEKNGSGTGGNGGNGGGILIIIAREIDLSGMTIVRSNGANGNNGGGSAGGGGGGAGGSILLKGQNINVGTGKITASGSTGGSAGGGDGTAGQTGGGGSVGRIRAEYSKSFSGTTSPTASTAQDKVFDEGGGFFAFM